MYNIVCFNNIYLTDTLLIDYNILVNNLTIKQ